MEPNSVERRVLDDVISWLEKHPGCPTPQYLADELRHKYNLPCPEGTCLAPK